MKDKYTKYFFFVALLVAGVFAFGYLIQVFSPLRLNTDSVRLLSMAVSAYQGNGYLVQNQPDQYPVGYPFLVRLLLQVGWANSATLIFLNLFFLAVAIFVLLRVSEDGSRLESSLLVAYIFSSWILIKHITLPISDVAYLGISFLCLFFLWEFFVGSGKSKWWWFLAALLLALAALIVRSVGIVLLPVLPIILVLHREILPHFKKLFADKVKISFVLLVFIGLGSVVSIFLMNTNWFELQFVKSGSYFQSFLKIIESKGLIQLLLQIISYRCLEFGELILNMPSGKLPQMLAPVFYLAGGFTWLLTFYGLYLQVRQRRLLPFLLYFVTYVGLMSIWPYYDTRFWIPLLPIISLLVFKAILEIKKRWPVIQWGSLLYLVVFFILGFVALFYSSRISLSGKDFSEVYGDGHARMTYRYAFQNGKDVDLTQVDEGQLLLLGIFEPQTVRNHIERK